MIANIGYLLLCVSIFASIAALLPYLFLLGRAKSNITVYSPSSNKFLLYANNGGFFLSSNLCVIASFFCLLYLFITRDFTVVSVLMNTSSIMELQYRIAACWSCHETSLLFWIFVTSVLNIIFYFQNKESKVPQLISLSIQLFFVICIFFYSNPFKTIVSTPSEGLGMNPSLQDIGVMIHPPILYTAYSIFQIIFSCTISSMFGCIVPEKKSALNWSRLGLSTLTSAVGLGGWWAYRELGWGGYWFFDPVENISLIVWLFAISYHHSLLQQNMVFTKIFFGILPFLFSVFGTFLVRSGLLVSVHSFAESPSTYIFLVFSIFLFLSSFLLIYLKRNDLFTHNIILSSKYCFMQAGNIFWGIASLILIISIFVPIFYGYFFKEVIEINIRFFVYSVIPAMLFSSILSGAVYFNRKIQKLYFVALCHVPIFIFAGSNLLESFAYFSGCFIITSSIIRLYEKIKDSSLKLSSISMLLGHSAAGIFIVAVCFNNQYGISKTINIHLHESAKIDRSKKLYLTDIKYDHGANYVNQRAYLRISDNGNEIVILKPELRFYPVEKKFSSEVSIYGSVFADWYAVINNADGNFLSVQIFYHPAIFFIWFSLLLMVIAVALRL